MSPRPRDGGPQLLSALGSSAGRQRRAAAAGLPAEISCHSFRATGITEYLRNDGRLEVAQQMANHESSRTTELYDRRHDQISLDEVERILI